MKKMTRILSFLIISTMVLSGCSNDSKDSGNISNVDKDKLYTEVGTYPIVNEPISLNVFIPQSPNIIDFETNDFSKHLEELTGIDLVFETAPGDAVKEKVNLLMTSGDLPDVFIASAPDEARFGVEEGLLLDLTELIDTQMVNFKKALEQREFIKGSITATDGNIYTLPSFNECYHCTISQKMWVNTMWLEQIGEKAPTTTEEFYNLCKKFKEINPEGIPIIGGGAWNGDPFGFIANAFTYISPSQYGLYEQNGEIKTAVTNDEYKEALRYMNKLYEEKLLYEASFTMSADQMKSLLVSEGEPVLFFPEGASVNLIDSTATPELYSHYYPIAPLKGPEGVQYATHFPSEPYSAFAITKDCQYPEAAMRLADYFYSLEGGLEMNAGREGTDWVYASEGQTGIDGKPALYEKFSAYGQEPQNKVWQDIGIKYYPNEFRFGEAIKVSEDMNIFAPENLEYLLYKTSNELYEPYIPQDKATVPTLKFLLDESQQMQTIAVEVEKYIKESKVRFITGDLDIDKEWDTYVQGVKNAGMDTLIEIYQTAYNRQFK